MEIESCFITCSIFLTDAKYRFVYLLTQRSHFSLLESPVMTEWTPSPPFLVQSTSDFYGHLWYNSFGFVFGKDPFDAIRHNSDSDLHL